MINVLNLTNTLNNHGVNIGGTDLIKEVIYSAEIMYTNNSPKVLCELTLLDLYALNMLLDWKDSLVKITYTDVFNESFEKEFKILNVKERISDENEKILTLELQDVFSYTLENSYTTKSFTGNVVDALTDFISELGLSNHDIDFTTSDAELNFAVPLHMNNLEFFEKEIQKYGFVMYQTKDKIFLKSYDDLTPSLLEENDPGKPYLNATSNQMYKNRIHEILPQHNQRNNTPPISRGIAYDITKKKMVYEEANSIDELVLNTNTNNLQETIGKRDLYQTHLNFDDLRLKMKNSFMEQHEMVIIVNGYYKNDLNQLYELELRGNKSTSDLHSMGDMILGGHWVSHKITDKIIGDKLIQKITLHRADMVKKV